MWNDSSDKSQAAVSYCRRGRIRPCEGNRGQTELGVARQGCEDKDVTRHSQNDSSSSRGADEQVECLDIEVAALHTPGN